MTGEPATIPILHHLARSGGTLIAKCLGAMPRVRLLSEIHPIGAGLGMIQFHPAAQARDWFGLASDDDVHALQPLDERFAPMIADLARRARDRGFTLVLRDWSHLDYMGAPWVRHPPGRSLLDEALRSHGLETRRVYTTRHPADQWLSARQLTVLAQSLSLEAYLRGCRALADTIADAGLPFVRYEDFCREPAKALRTICAGLGIDYDPAWMDGWRSYTTITGETSGGRGGAGRSAEIRPLPRRAIEPDLARALSENPDYAEACVRLGYDP